MDKFLRRKCLTLSKLPRGFVGNAFGEHHAFDSGRITAHVSQVDAVRTA